MGTDLTHKWTRADAQRTPAAQQPAASAVPVRGAQRAVVICDQWLGSDGYAGMKALRRAGWNVRVVPEWEYIPVRWRRLAMKALGRLLRPAAVREFNDDVIRVTESVGAELLLAFKGTWIDARTLRHLRARGVATYCFYPDVSFRAHGPYLPLALPEYDWIFTSKTFGLRDMREQLGITRASLLMLAFDPDLHRPLELTPADRARFGCDVSYIGTWSPKKEALLRELLRRRPRLAVKIWGPKWHKARPEGSLGRAIAGRELLVGEDYVRAICASTINLSIMSEARLGSSMGDQIAGRTFNIPASGGFVVHERTQELLALLREDEEVVCYADMDELVQKIDEYLPDEPRRRAIAERARALVVAHHSWDHRIRCILDHHFARSP